jgi:hypothetical protein
MEPASPTARLRRLTTLSGVIALSASGAHAQTDGYGLPADEVRRIAADILSERRFTGPSGETFLARIGRALTNLIGRIGDWFGRFLDQADAAVPGGREIVQLVIVLAVIGGAAWTAHHLARRRTRATLAAEAERNSMESGVDPNELETAAAAAAGDGRYTEAIRLRYQAGLLRLGERGRIVYRPSLTTGEVSDRLRVGAFDEIAATFDAVAYGNRQAGADDAERSDAGWRRLLAEERS